VNHDTRRCEHCKQQAEALDQVRTTVWFDATIRPIIHAFKYQNRFGLAHPLAQMMAEKWPTWRRPVDYIIPIPLHPNRERERGYNQAQLLAADLSSLVQQPVGTNELFRNKHTRTQVGLNYEERSRNVADAFVANGRHVRGKHILLIDDVYTTGATMMAAATALRQAGATSVSGYAVARAHGTLNHHFVHPTNANTSHK
jgi:ComF family protein